MPLVAPRGRKARAGSCSGRLKALEISFQLMRSWLAYMGRPGNVMKLENVQKNVLFSSGTKVHVGSGWKPLVIGLWYVETFWAEACIVKSAAVMPATVVRSIVRASLWNET